MPAYSLVRARCGAGVVMDGAKRELMARLNGILSKLQWAAR
jgi:hypothetical protein